MKKILLILAFLITGFGADAATRPAPRGQRTTNQQANVATLKTTTEQSPSSQTQSRSARTTAARTATPTTSDKTRGRAATPQATAPASGVVSRAAKQSVISTGTKVTAAAQNTVVDEKCWNGFMGCMDSFCMLDNANGGRCICSDKNAEYDAILAEIQSLDEQSYQMATVGVERIEMGDSADAVMKRTQEITKNIEKDSAQSKRKSLDLSAWNLNEIDFDADAEDIFSLSSDGVSLKNKTGDALYRAAAKLCNAQIPECKSQSTMMELMYQQRVRSDCTAYENSLRQQRTQSAQKLAAAQSAMREAALEQYRNANKYDLGQCTVQFKQCMQTTAGCGDDFSGCVGSIQEVTTGVKFDNLKTKKIKGTSSTITIAQSTYDILEAKKELCMTVTQECVNVRNQVWDTFIREVAPQVKSAELMAESDMRTSCISNIAACFQKGCKDNMDPNDPEGSYDMCLTRPEMVEDICKIQVEPCKNSIPNIMEYVRARLASMRVDSCTKEFKSCLTSEDRCGPDYTQCVGLDTDTIVKMCPADKLPGCKYNKIGEANNDSYVYQNLANIAQGIFLNIDNNMLTACQRAADAAMIKVCGSTENCDELIVDNGLGSRSLEYKICEYKGNKNTLNITYDKCRPNIDMITDEELGRNGLDVSGTGENVTITPTANKRKDLASVIDGLIYWESVTVDNDGKLISATDYFNKLGQNANTVLTESQKQRITGELAALQTSINTAIDAIESDQTVKYCMEGRDNRWRYTQNNALQGTGGTNFDRFPNLTKQMRNIITTSALAATKENYYAKYDELNEKMLKDYSKIAERVAEIKGSNNKDLRRDVARDACIKMAESSTLARSAEPPASAGTYILGNNVLMSSLASPVPGAAIAGIVMSAIILSSASDDANGQTYGAQNSGLSGSQKMQQWNYKETITTTFDWENLICHKCVRSTKCEVTRNPLIGDKYCETWGEETETCTDTQF